MLEQLLFHLERLDEEEQFFGTDFLHTISCAELADSYLLKIYNFEPLILYKEDSFPSNLFTAIHYLTEKKSQYVNGPEPEKVSQYYRDWLYYKQCYLIRKAWFYLNIENVEDIDEVTDQLIHILGLINYNTVTQIFQTSNEDYLGHGAIAMSYVGNSRAVRDLSMKYLDPLVGTQWQFHLWHLTPTTITDTYDYVFYLGNELSKIDYCPYDYKAKEYYYEALYLKIYRNLEKNIPKNDGITAKRKQEILNEINEHVLQKPPKEDFHADSHVFDEHLSFDVSDDFDDDWWFDTEEE